MSSPKLGLLLLVLEKTHPDTGGDLIQPVSSVDVPLYAPAPLGYLHSLSFLELSALEPLLALPVNSFRGLEEELSPALNLSLAKAGNTSGARTGWASIIPSSILSPTNVLPLKA